MRLLLVLLVLAPAAVLACSPAPMSLLERLTGATAVFVGRMEAERADGSFDLRVLESFKGAATEKTVPTKLSVGTQCGFDKPKRGDRYLVFVRGDLQGHRGRSQGLRAGGVANQRGEAQRRSG